MVCIFRLANGYNRRGKKLQGIALKSFFQKDSVIISMLSILSFIAAYLFECGYSDAFGYSHAFIQIDLKVMVISIACLIALFFPLVMYFFIFFSLVFRREKEIRLVALPMILPIPVLILFYILGFESSILKWMLLLAVLMGLCTFLNVVYKSRSKGWKIAMSEVAAANGLKDFGGQRNAESAKEATVLDKVIGYLVVVLILAVLGLMVRGVGSGVAHWKTTYQTFILDGDEVAILSVYGDYIIVGGVTEDKFNAKLTVLAKDSGKLIDLKEADFESFLSKPLRFQ